MLMGSNFADNKGNATAYLTYDNQGAALQSKFDYSACSLAPASATHAGMRRLRDVRARTARAALLRLDRQAASASSTTRSTAKTGVFRPFQCSD